MSRFFHPLLAMMACCTRQELAPQVAYLKEENRILRARLPKRIIKTLQERRRLVRAGRKQDLRLKELLTICTTTHSADGSAKWRLFTLSPGSEVARRAGDGRQRRS